MKQVYIYKFFERFWHWMQALLIGILMITGFEIHSTYNLLGYETAVNVHDISAWAFLVLIVFAIFWHFTTGEWRQYIPTTKLVKAQVDYYLFGIFKGAHHPTKKLIYNKFNPLQRIIYLGLKVLVIPVQVISGFLYLYFHYPLKGFELDSLELVAIFHTFGAFMLLVFVIAHVYLTTTGHKPLSAIKAMVTGWEEMDDETIRERMADDIEIALLKTKSQFKGGSGESEILDNALTTAQEKAGIKAILKDNKFRDAISSSGVGYFCISKEGNYLEVNDSWAKLYRYESQKEIIGKHYRLSRTDEDFADLEKSVEKVLQGETINHGEVKRICKDGTFGYHTLTLAPVVTDGNIIAFEGFIIDTTDKLLAEKELLKKKIRVEEKLRSKNT
ncbi:MAG: PAS domain S-box protein [Prolixibacteraceae bacterium]|jgi:PAS domain S-box-containing protein|nr:PAS domain S-box protein [Prolixibacteraceae bacterium]MBT6005655.1 PAS domain S-box protein [Prolixibacteraceae bacterium]MBT6763138.1 PAS domain S-box protein [Prolixibacteraceae bacterium]MBT6999240.1 PAS domain S-box protein [Prolixibacteraceae bacterium]MBT7393277.1 PAS domain S-box protein [Prolixibacteraceae bacterium]